MANVGVPLYELCAWRPVVNGNIVICARVGDMHSHCTPIGVSFVNNYMDLDGIMIMLNLLNWGGGGGE